MEDIVLMKTSRIEDCSAKALQDVQALAFSGFCFGPFDIGQGIASAIAWRKAFLKLSGLATCRSEGSLYPLSDITLTRSLIEDLRNDSVKSFAALVRLFDSIDGITTVKDSRISVVLPVRCTGQAICREA